MSLLFDPYNDRTARLIRNELSAAFMEDMKMGELVHAPQVMAGFSDELRQVHRDYVTQRLAAYARVLQVIATDCVEDSLVKSLVLWDEQLFYEVHEWLEELWLAASSDRKKALQSLIRGAGAFVHLECGNKKGAKRMALKACAGLHDFGGELVPVALVIPLLCQGLNQLEPYPLYGRSQHE